MEILIKNGYLITMDSDNRVIKDGAVFIREDKIQDLGTSSELITKYQHSDTILDAKGRVVIPGMICGHMHFYSAFA
ncbi:MAG: putative aminohydrolase SsnA, partial [Candidatus Hodarchaeales archaeon]